MPKEIKDGDMKTFLLYLRGDEKNKVNRIGKSITIKTKNRYQKLVTQSNLINTRENLYLTNQLKGQISKAQKVNNENIKKIYYLKKNN